MSQTRSNSSEQTKREKLRALALSDRDTAPVYTVLYRQKYGNDPSEEVGQ